MSRSVILSRANWYVCADWSTSSAPNMRSIGATVVMLAGKWMAKGADTSIESGVAPAPYAPSCVSAMLMGVIMGRHEITWSRMKRHELF
eukprot:scaffold11696_cov93-Phaeocystis_antarctica.AAC.3